MLLPGSANSVSSWCCLRAMSVLLLSAIIQSAESLIILTLHKTSHCSLQCRLDNEQGSSKHFRCLCETYAKDRWFSSTPEAASLQVLLSSCLPVSALWPPWSGVSCLSIMPMVPCLPTVGLQMVTHSGPGNTENFFGIQWTVTNHSLMKSEF